MARSLAPLLGTANQSYLSVLYVDTSVCLHPARCTKNINIRICTASSGSARRALYRTGKRALVCFHLELSPGAYLSSLNTLLRFAVGFTLGKIDSFSTPCRIPLLGFVAGDLAGPRWQTFLGFHHPPPISVQTLPFSSRGGERVCARRRCRTLQALP